MVLFIKDVWLVTFSDKTRSEGNGQYNRYQHIYIDFFNVNQLAWDIEWIIAGDEAIIKLFSQVKMSAEH